METYLDNPDVFDYITFAAILIGVLCNILIIDTIIHKMALRSGARLVILTWSICDLFYLFSTSGFLHFLLKCFGLHVSYHENKIFILQPHLLDEPASSLMLQLNCLILMWILAFSSPNNTQSTTTAQLCIQWCMVLTFITIDLLIVFLKAELANHQIDNIRRAYITLLIFLIFINEFHYFQLMCDDEIDIDIVAIKLIKINIIRVYVYNWCFVYFMKYVAAYSFHESTTKYFYVLCICLTMTAFLTGFYVLIHLLCNDMHFRKSFICSCVALRGDNSINTDPNELSAIIMGARYHQLYYTSEVM